MDPSIFIDEATREAAMMHMLSSTNADITNVATIDLLDTTWKEFEPARDSREALACSDPENTMISPAMMSAVRCFHKMLAKESFWSDEKRVLEFFDLVDNHSRKWSAFLDWTCLMLNRICRCESSVESNKELAYMLDDIFWSLLQRTRHFHEQLRVNSRFLRAFARLWMNDEESGRYTMTLPYLLIDKIVTTEQLMDACGANANDLANLCLNHLRQLHPRLRTEDNVSPILDLSVELIYTLTTDHGLLEVSQALFVAGLVPCFIDVSRSLITRAEKDLSLGRTVLSAKASLPMISTMMEIVSQIMAYPAQIILAINNGIIPVALSTHLFWNQAEAAHGTPEGFLTELGEAVNRCLRRIQNHVHRLSVFRHLCRTLQKETPISDPLLLDSCPFRRTWRSLENQIQIGSHMKQTFEKDGVSYPCENANCPHRGTGARPSLKKCSRCLSYQVCSKACQRATWPTHRAVCDNIVQHSPNVRLLKPPGFMTLEEFRYYDFTAFQTANALLENNRSLYEEYRTRLQIGHPSTGLMPSHMLAVDFVPLPKEVRVEAISEYKGDKKTLDGVLENILTQPRRHGGAIIIHATFIFGEYPHDVFATYSP